MTILFHLVFTQLYEVSTLIIFIYYMSHLFAQGGELQWLQIQNLSLTYFTLKSLSVFLPGSVSKG
jgi:hypothetical protein